MIQTTADAFFKHQDEAYTINKLSRRFPIDFYFTGKIENYIAPAFVVVVLVGAGMFMRCGWCAERTCS